jgi:hypothetical protein
MKPILSALATAVLIGSSLLLGTGAATAVELPPCPPNHTMVVDASGTVGTCVRNPAPPPTAPIACSPDGNTCLWNGTPPRGPAPANVPAPPPYKPLPQAPVAVKPPVAVPAAPAHNAVPGAGPAQGSYQSGQPAGTGTTVPAQQAAAPADAPVGAAPAIVLPANEAQAVDALRSATATAAEKEAALAIVKTKINAVLDEAIGKALSNR